MLIPVDADVDVAVTVVVLGEAVAVAFGRLVRLEQETLQLIVPDPPIPVGARLVVTVGDRTRLPGRVIEVGDGGRLRVSRDGAHAVDDRAAPRVTGNVPARWRTAGDEAEAWITGGPHPGPFQAVAGEIEVSVSGMLLGPAGPPPPVGARVLLELEFEPGEPSRAVGIVRRNATRDGRPHVGIEFVELPESTLDALSAFTLERL